jgi:hypothetical protein
VVDDGNGIGDLGWDLGDWFNVEGVGDRTALRISQDGALYTGMVVPVRLPNGKVRTRSERHLQILSWSKRCLRLHRTSRPISSIR